MKTQSAFVLTMFLILAAVHPVLGQSSAARPAGSNPQQSSSAQVRPQSLTEKAIDGFAASHLLDLVLRANPDDGNARVFRPLSGELSIRGDGICVNVAPFFKPDGPEISLNALGPIQPGLNSSLKLLYIYSSLRVDPARIEGSSIQNDPTFKEDFGWALEAALKKRFGRAISVNMFGGSGCMADAWLLPRLLIDRGAEPRPLQGEIIDIATISVADLRAAHSARIAAIEAKKMQAAGEKVRLLASADIMVKSAPRGPEALYGVFAVSSGRVVPCSVKPDPDNTPRFGMDVRALLSSAEFKAYMPERPEGGTLFSTVDDLFSDLKAPKGKCTVVVGNGPLLGALIKGLVRDGVQLSLVEKAFSEDDLADLHAADLGFEDMPNLSAVDAWLLALDIGGGKPVAADIIEALRTLGVADRRSYDDAVARLTKSGLPPAVDASDVVQFLADQRDAAKRGISVVKLRDQREAAARAAEAKVSTERRAADARKAVEFPFIAILSCTIRETVQPLQACMSDNGVDTEIELRNGGDYRLYKMYEVSELGEWTDKGVEVDLRRAFAIKVQNASATLVLNLAIVNRSSGNIVFRKSAGKYGVVQAGN